MRQVSDLAMAGAGDSTKGYQELMTTHLVARFEQLQRIARRIVDQDLAAAGAGDRVAAETRPGCPKGREGGIQVGDPDDEPIPTARLWLGAIGQRL